ncbi:hypothetical protein OKW27_001681 [Paraburkholderia sp. 35.1]
MLHGMNFGGFEPCSPFWHFATTERPATNTSGVYDELGRNVQFEEELLNEAAAGR